MQRSKRLFITVFTLFIGPRTLGGTPPARDFELVPQASHERLMNDWVSTIFTVSPDWRLLASVDRKTRGVRLWDIESEKVIGHFRAATMPPQCLKFSPDGTLLAAREYRATKIYDTRSKTLLQDLPTDFMSGPCNFYFSDDAKSLYIPLAAKSLEVWSTTAPVKLYSISGGDFPEKSLFNRLFDEAADCTLPHTKQALVSELRANRMPGGTTNFKDYDDNWYYSPVSKRSLRVSKTNLSIYDPASSTITSISLNPVPNFRLLANKEFTKFAFPTVSNKIVLVKRILPLETSLLGAEVSPVGIIAPAKDSKRFAVLHLPEYAGTDTLSIWDISGKLLQTIAARSLFLSSSTFKFSNGEFLPYAPGQAKSLRIDPTKDYVFEVEFEAGKFRGRGFDITRGQHFNFDLNWPDICMPAGTISAHLSESRWTSLTLISGAELISSTRPFTSPGCLHGTGSAYGWAALQTKDQDILIADASTGKTVKTIPAKIFGTNGPAVKKVLVAEDGKTLFCGLFSGEVLLIDIQKEAISGKLSGHTAPIIDLIQVPRTQLLLSSADDNSLRLWNLRNGQSIAIMGNGSEWLIYTPDGYFDASPHGGELVAIAKGLKAYGIDQFAARYNRPDLILERLGIGTPEQISHYYAQYQKRLKKLALSEADFSSDLHVPEVTIEALKREGKFATVKFKATDSKYPLKSYSIYVNNVQVMPSSKAKVTGKFFSTTERLELTPGKNKIEVSALNSAGAGSFRALAYADYDGKEKGDLYYLALGTSKYKDSTLNLDYADKDAQDLQVAVSKMTQGFDKIHTKVLLNSEVTFQNIAKAKAFLEGTKTGDTVILFVAGHGGYSKGKDAEYYYLPYDADQARLETTGVKFDEIEDLLSGIKARKKLFLLDTCESGELEEGIYGQYYALAGARGIKPRTARNPAGKRGISANVRPYLHERDRFIYNNLARRTGAIVFSSSKGGEISYESADIANGFFTEEVLRALTDRAADKNGDRRISSDELRDYVSPRVADNTGGLQHPTVDRDNIYQKVDIPSLAY